MGNHTTFCAKLFIATAILVASILATPTTAATRYLTGRVLDASQSPVVGASVQVHSGDSTIAGTATDSDGAYRIKLRNFDQDRVEVSISAVGYESTRQEVDLTESSTEMSFGLTAVDVEIDGVAVYPAPVAPLNRNTTSRENVAQAARNSLITTNPVSAIQRPQVVREGSAHSSKLRVNGTTPKYFINGVEIGANPNHYGVFSFIPSSVVDRLEFSSLGTNSAHDQPSMVEFETGAPFRRHFAGELNLSLVEATGSWSLGGERWFVLGALRKSVLDKIVNSFDVDQERRTIPPSSFQDIFVSSGYKLTPRMRLAVDQYHVRDYLSYRSEPTSQNAGGTQTALQTSEQYLGVRLEAVTGRTLIRARAATRSSHERYLADPNASDTSRLFLDLAARTRTNSLSSDVTFFLGDVELSIGDRFEYVSKQQIDLHQHDWNFLPPDANSDNPFLYQPELNALYGDYHADRTRLSNALYSSVAYRIGPVEVTSGARLYTFRNLSQNNVLALREEVIIPTGERSRLRLFYGSFYESPVQKVLEPYQVLIHSDLGRLQPVRTTLLAAGYQFGPIHFQAFRKSLDNIPVAAPDFSAVDEDGAPIDGFIRMHSSGSADFVGGDVSVEIDNLLNSRVSFYGYYGYTDARRRTGSVVVPYEINAPHRLFSQVRWQLSRVVGLGADLSVRSGYSYTPTPSGVEQFGQDRYSAGYWAAAQQTENSRRFPTNAALNLHASFSTGSTDIYLSVANVTNHGNAIVNTYDGYVYDTGILPSIGLTTRF